MYGVYNVIHWLGAFPSKLQDFIHIFVYSPMYVNSCKVSDSPWKGLTRITNNGRKGFYNSIYAYNPNFSHLGHNRWKKYKILNCLFIMSHNSCNCPIVFISLTFSVHSSQHHDQDAQWICWLWIHHTHMYTRSYWGEFNLILHLIIILENLSYNSNIF